MRGLVLIRERRRYAPPQTSPRPDTNQPTKPNLTDFRFANRMPQKLPPNQTQSPDSQMKARTEGEVAAKPLGVLRLSPSRAVFIFVLFGTRLRILICFRHLVYHFLAYFAYKTTFVPTVEVVKKQQFFIFLPYGAGNVVVHNIGYEILRQTP